MSIRFHRYRHSSFSQHLMGILTGFAALLDGIVTVGSLGFLCSNFELTACSLRARLCIAQLKSKRENHDHTE